MTVVTPYSYMQVPLLLKDRDYSPPLPRPSPPHDHAQLRRWRLEQQRLKQRLLMVQQQMM